MLHVDKKISQTLLFVPFHVDQHAIYLASHIQYIVFLYKCIHEKKPRNRINKMTTTSNPSTGATSDRTEEESMHCAWKDLQYEELAELQYAAVQAKKGENDDHQLTQLIQKIIQHFQDYTNNRTRRAQIDVSPFFAPVSCTPLVNSVLWIAGCRPSSFLRFVYVLCGMDIDSHLADFLQGKKVGDLGELTSKQMNMIDALQAKTINQEKILTSKLASLQEDIVDQPIASKIKNEMGECGNADEALDEHGRHWRA